MELDFSKILKEVLEMKKDYSEKNVLQIRYNYLYTWVPSLFELICENREGDEFLSILEVLMRNAGNLREGNSTKEEADKVVVERLNKKYIDPVIKND